MGVGESASQRINDSANRRISDAVRRVSGLKAGRHPGCVSLGQTQPVIQREGLCSAKGIDLCGLEQLACPGSRPTQTARQRIAECFTLLAETGFAEAEERIQQRVGDARSWIQVNPQDGRINLGGWVKSLGGDVRCYVRLTINLNTERQQAKIAWSGAAVWEDGGILTGAG
jgi:hypothetical protein